MKMILILGIVLSLLVISGYANLPEQSSKGALVMEQHEKDIDICRQNLLAMGKAIAAYKNEHDAYPEWLSDLHPKYLRDEKHLLCRAEKIGSKPIMPQKRDPKMPVSYSYEFNPDWRAWKTEQRTFFGDAMPLIRCQHHVNEDFQVLNLSFSSRVYPSASFWERHPEMVYGSLEAAIAALSAGFEQHPGHKDFFYMYPILTGLYMQTEDEHAAEDLVNAYKKVMTRESVEDHFILSDMLQEMNRDAEALALFKALEKQHPKDRRVHQKLAALHGRLSELHSQMAAASQLKADPSEMLGTRVPDFSATDLDGHPISLQDYRGKVVLLDFWAVWCAPCIAEMPNLKRVYATYKDEGFDIIGISLDTDEAKLRDYLKAQKIPWRQVFSGDGWQSRLVREYNIGGIPAPWLIARDGTLISTLAKGIALKQMVAEALKDKSADP